MPSKMFPPLFPQGGAPNGQTGPTPFLKRAGFFACALVLLWLAVQLSSGGRSDADYLYTDGPGTVASNPSLARIETKNDSLIRPGYVAAMLLLAGGAGLALYLRKRNPVASAGQQPVLLLGKVQISPTQHLRLVSCGGDVLLLGVTSSQISLLKTYPSTAFVELASAGEAGEDGQPNSPIRNEAAVAGAYGRGFADVLRQFTGNAVPARISEGA